MTTVSHVAMKRRAVAVIAKVGSTDPFCALAIASAAAKHSNGGTQRCPRRVSLKT
jgi:hypothetical protein